MRRVALALIVLALLIGGRSHAQSGQVAVTVTGTGNTLEEARLEAMRLALQSALSQLVVARREISGSKIVQDKVISSMNGYVDAIRVLSQKRSADGFSLTAEIVISTSRIENFIGVVASKGGEFDAGGILAERERRRAEAEADSLRRQAVAEIFDHALRDFPSRAMTVTTQAVELSDKNPDLLRIRFDVGFVRAFQSSFEQTIAAIAEVQCRRISRTEDDGPILSVLVNELSRSKSSCTGTRCKDCDGPISVVCIEDDREVRCYGLPLAPYCQTCRLSDFSNNQATILDSGGRSKALVIYGRFVDGSGQSASSRSDCLELLAEPDTKKMGLYGYSIFGPEFINIFVEKSRRSRDGDTLMAAFDFKTKPGIVTIPISAVDLSRAKYFVATAGLAKVFGISRELPSAVVTSLLPSGEGGCELLREAVANRQLSGLGRVEVH